MKTLQFIFEIFVLQKFSNFVNSNDYIGIITPKSIRLQPVFMQKINLKLIKNIFYLVKK